jgi:NDP-sugar pyrophosphorylase family protein
MPLVAYQISFLESNGVFDIYVAVNKKEYKKVEKMLKALCSNTPNSTSGKIDQNSLLDIRTNLVLIVFEE